MFKLMLYIYVYIVIGGLFVYVLKCKYLLVTLLGLEYVSLGLFVGLVFLGLFIGLSMDLLIVFLIIMVCEGVLGLSLLVIMVRSRGVDYYSVLGILRC